MRYSMPAETHERLFGKPDLEPAETGRSRRCKTCGDWHPLSKPWPHNCRPPQDTPPQRLAAPRIAPSFEPFVTGRTDTAEVIGSRNDKREYMKRNDLVEHDEGVGDRNQWVEDRENEREIVADIKRFHETDPENLSPDLKAQRMDEGGSLDEGTEISATDIEMVK